MAMSFMQMNRSGSRWCRTVAGVLTLLSASAVRADIAFQYDEIADPIVSATFSVDFAAMNAHRTVSETEMNFAFLVDCNASGGLPDYDLSDDLFGTASPPDDPQLDMGVLETGTGLVYMAVGPRLRGGRTGGTCSLPHPSRCMRPSFGELSSQSGCYGT